MRCTQNEFSESEIAELFEGDRQLVKLWRSFIIHNKWVYASAHGKWEVTDKGKEIQEKYKIWQTTTE